MCFAAAAAAKQDPKSDVTQRLNAEVKFIGKEGAGRPVIRSGAVGRYWAIVPHENGFDVQAGNFKTVGAAVGADAGASIGVAGMLGSPEKDLAGYSTGGEWDVGPFGTIEVSRADTGAPLVGISVGLGTPFGSAGRFNTEVSQDISMQENVVAPAIRGATGAFDSARRFVANTFRRTVPRRHQ